MNIKNLPPTQNTVPSNAYLSTNHDSTSKETQNITAAPNVINKVATNQTLRTPIPDYSSSRKIAAIKPRVISMPEENPAAKIGRLQSWAQTISKEIKSLARPQTWRGNEYKILIPALAVISVGIINSYQHLPEESSKFVYAIAAFTGFIIGDCLDVHKFDMKKFILENENALLLSILFASLVGFAGQVDHTPAEENIMYMIFALFLGAGTGSLLDKKREPEERHLNIIHT